MLTQEQIDNWPQALEKTVEGMDALAEGVGALVDRAIAWADLDAVRGDHAAWSAETFGGVGPVGALKHLAKEAQEAAEAPSDPEEYVDCQFLIWDAMRRAGISDAEFLEHARAKLEKLRGRTYPEAVEGQPCEHVRDGADD